MACGCLSLRYDFNIGWLHWNVAKSLLHVVQFNLFNKRTSLLARFESVLFPEQECIPVGCVPSAAVAVYWGCLPGRGVSAGGVYPSMHWGRHLPPMDRTTDRCKNITFPQLRLRTVIHVRGTEDLGKHSGCFMIIMWPINYYSDIKSQCAT